MTELDPLPYQDPGRGNSYAAQLKVLGILLIVASGITILANLLFIFSVTIQIISGGPHPPPAMSPASKDGFYVGFYAPLVLGIIAIPLSGITLAGAIGILTRRRYRLARAVCVLAVIPFSASCCCFLTLPLGIWGLLLLAKVEVKQLFT